MIQIRHVPGALHREPKSRGALAGMSLSEFLPNELRQVAERPTLDQLRARLYEDGHSVGSASSGGPLSRAIESLSRETRRHANMPPACRSLRETSDQAGISARSR